MSTRPNLADLPRSQLLEMHAAALEITERYQGIAGRGGNLLDEVLTGRESFYEFERYPEHRVASPESGSEYYYHCHRGDEGEHGHFHAFLRLADATFVHLAAIRIDERGLPVGLFTVNRWTTDEAWRSAKDVIAVLPRFSI